MKVKLVTSFNKRIFDDYAHKSLPTWIEHLDLPEGSQIEVWINGPFPKGLPKVTKNGIEFKYKMLDTQSLGWQTFYETHGNHPRPQMPQGQEYRFNFLPFSCKVFALAEAAYAIKTDETNSFDVLMWIDADVTFKKAFGATEIAQMLFENSFAWLDRGRPWGHGETGFMAMRTQDENLDLFLQTADLYGSGALFYFAEWHDAFVYTSQVRLKVYSDPNFKVLNLNTDMDSEVEQGLFPFKTSPLNEYMDHFKGPRKEGIK